MTQSTRTPGPSADAAAANALGAQSVNQDSLQVEDGQTKTKAQAQAKQAEKKTGEKGFQTLDLTKVGPTTAAQAAIAQLVMGSAPTQATVAGAEVQPDNAQALALFGTLVQTLQKPDGKPGAAFAPDAVEARDVQRFFPIDLAVPPSAALSQTEGLASLGATPPAKSAAARSDVPTTKDRVQLVRYYQRLSDKLLTKQAEIPPQTRAALAPAAAAVQQAFALVRAQQPALWNKLPTPLTGRASDLNKLLANQSEAVSAAAQGEIQIPSPAVVQLEKAAGAMRGLDFGSADIESLAIMVMMSGAKVEGDITRDQLLGMDKLNKQKEALRKMQTQSQQQQAQLTHTLQNEFNALKASGQLHQTITFDQYKSWRECAYAALRENVGLDGSVSYELPQPQVVEPSPPTDIPEWLKTGTAAPIAKEKSNADQGLTYGMPEQVVSALKRIYNDCKSDGQSFEEYLSQIGLEPASDVDGIEANLKFVTEFLQKGPQSPAFTPTQISDVKTPGDVKKAVRELEDLAQQVAKDRLLSAAFPGIVDPRLMEDHVDALNSALDKAQLNQAVSEQYSKWLKDDAAGYGKFVGDYKAKVNTMFAEIFGGNSEFYNKDFKDKDKNPDDPNWKRDIGSHSDTFLQSDFNALDLLPGNQNLGHNQALEHWGYDGTDITKATPRYQVVNGKVEFFIEGEVTFRNVDGARWDSDYAFLCEFTGSKDIMADLNALTSKGANTDAQDVPGTVGQGASNEQAQNRHPGMGLSGWDAGVNDGRDDAKVPDFDPTMDPGYPAWQAKQADLATAFGQLKDRVDTLGDPSDPKTQWAKWAKKNGFLTSDDPAAPKPSAPPPQAILDPGTNLVLDHRGNADMVAAQLQEIKDKLDTLNGLTEVEQLRLQSQMERRSKLFDTLSNILKNISNTDAGITANMK